MIAQLSITSTPVDSHPHLSRVSLWKH